MNKLWFPQIGNYLVFTSDIVHHDQGADGRRALHWGIKEPNPLRDRSIYPYQYPVRLAVKKFDWFEVNAMFAPRKSWKTWEGFCLVGLKLELSKKDRKFIRERVHELARERCGKLLLDEGLTAIDPANLQFSIRSRTIEVSTLDINGKAMVVSSREDAIALVSKLRGEAEIPEPTRWERLGT